MRSPVLVPRLKTREEFRQVLSAPVVSKTAHFALHRLGNTGTFVRIGAVTPKRLAKRSVTRNLLKRQIYVQAENLAQASQLDPSLTICSAGASAYVVRLRSSFAADRFPSASSDALKRAARLELEQLCTLPQLQRWALHDLVGAPTSASTVANNAASAQGVAA